MSSKRLFCDVCWAKPNKQGMTFQQCKTCGVGVHNECYGLPTGYKSRNPDFECWACKAVGKTVRVRQRDESTESKKRLELTVQERPTECCLCSVDDGKDWYHAMHPIYDHYGATGRQLLLPPNIDHDHPRLAWGHTLCCFAINSHSQTSGCVYGCTADGAYDDVDTQEDDDGGDDNSDTSSVNSELLGNEPSDETIHHFTYCLRKSGQPDNQWTKVIREQQQLKCYICGEDDRVPNSFRIPVQCSANDDHEFEDFSKYHVSLCGDTCYVNMHVGCSIWGRNDAGELPTCRRVYYFPGRDESVKNTAGSKKRYTQTVTNILCEVHAQDLVGNVKGATLLRYPEHLNKKSSAALSSHDDGITRSDTRATAAHMKSNRSHHHEVNPDLRAHHWTKAPGLDATTSLRTMAMHAKHHGGKAGDVRSRLGIREPSDMDVHRFHGTDLISGAQPRVMHPQLHHHAQDPRQHDRRKSASSEATAGVKRKAAPPPQAKESSLQANAKLAQIVQEIVEKENQGADHLEVILAETKERWKDDVVCTPDFWEKVIKKVSVKLNYSREESDWSFLSKAGSLEEDDKMQWDTVDVICLGNPPGHGDV